MTTPQMGWIIKTHENDASNEARAAIAALVHLNFEKGDPSLMSQMVPALQATHAVANLMSQYVASAQVSGVVGVIGGNVSVGGTKMTATLTGIGVTNSTGQWVAGIPLTATLSGPGVWDSTGTVIWTGVTTNAPLSLGLHSTGNGSTHAKFKFDVPSSSVAHVNRPGSQDTLKPAVDDPRVETAQSPEFELVFDFQPMLTSKVNEKVTPFDATEVCDDLDVSADPAYMNPNWLVIGGKPVSVKWEGKLYEIGSVPTPPSATIPAGVTPVATVTLTTAGPGSYQACVDRPDSSTMYTWVWSVTKTKQTHEVSAGVPASTYIHADWSDAYGLADETFSNPHKADLSSAASHHITKKGRHIIDDLYVEDLPDDHPSFTGGAGFGPDAQTIETSLYFFAGMTDDEVDAASWDDGQLIHTVSTPAKNGYYPSIGSSKFRTLVDENDVEIPGIYQFKTSHAGSDRVYAYQSDIADRSERVVVQSVPPVIPELETVATDKNGEKETEPTKDMVIVDEVCDTNKSLVPGKEYEIVTTLQLLPDNKPLLDADGKPITVTTLFTPKTADECAIIEITFDASGLAGKQVNVFEDVWKDRVLLTSHADITNKKQTITFPQKAQPTPEAPTPLAETGTTKLASVLLVSLLLTSSGITFKLTKKTTPRH